MAEQAQPGDAGAAAAAAALDEVVRLLARRGPVGSAAADPDGRLVGVNPAFAGLVGRAPAALVGMSWADLAHPDDCAIVADALEALRGGGLPRTVEARWLRPDGTTSWTRLFAHRRGESDGALAGFAMQVVDIAPEHEAEERRREAEARVRHVAESGIVGVFEATLDGIVDANDEFLALVGASRDDLEAGRLHWIDVTPAEWTEADADALNELRVRGACTPFEKEYERPDGSRVPVRVGAALVEAHPMRWVSFVADLTEHKRVEQVVADARDRVDEARREQRRRAAALRQSLLPDHLPSVPGLEVAVRARAGTADPEVGGAFYDLVPIDEGRWGVLIGDRAGTDVPGSTIMALARFTVRAVARHGAPPARVLSWLDEALRDLGAGEACTALYGELQAADDQGFVLRFAPAGNPLPLHLRGGWGAMPVGNPGPVLGGSSGLRPEEVELPLRRGDGLVLYTAGLAEGLPTAGSSGEQIAALVERCAVGDADAIADHVAKEVRAHQGPDATARDSVLMVLRCV